ncbi:isoflavone reductase [Dorcoceras hygrometricum]|uniref:Isoflavone reductase n=1 Tax=Dorcoceras hygrometricum TaxID=472368 RepID=A0A2Z7BF06_9LAMI|nr:isoflavone reductase [Dorcoceras hygrometricum]
MQPAPTTEMRPAQTPKVLLVANPEVLSAEVGAGTRAGPGRASFVNIFEDSFVVFPSGSAVTGLLCNMVPDKDLELVQNAPDLDVVGSLTVRFTEVINRLTWAQREMTSTRQYLYEVFEHHTELAKQLEKLEAIRAEEKRASEAMREALEAENKSLTTAKEALVADKEALAAELANARAQAEEEIKGLRFENERLKGEAENAWVLSNEEFLKSSEFDDLCAQKSLAYFECGFKGCLDQFRANGYSEEEHPASFLSVARALEELPDDEEEADEGTSRDEASPPNSPVL